MSSGYTYDSGTGVLDKASIREYSIQALKEVPSEGKANWLAIGDIDEFKHVNDTYGHAFGDEVLKLVADTFTKYMEGIGQVGRFGGDEFFFCFSDVDEEAVRNVLRMARSEILQKTSPDMEGAGITMTIGVVDSPENGTEYDGLFDKADKALYIGKGKGKNRYIIYRESMHGNITVPQSETKIRYVQDYTLRLTESVNKCMDKLLLTGADQLGNTMDVLMDTLLLDYIAIYRGEEKRGTLLPDGNDGIKQPLTDPSNKGFIRDTSLPDFDWKILDEIRASAASFATGLLVINNVNNRRNEYPVTTSWMDGIRMREAIIFCPHKKGLAEEETPVFVIASAKPRMWGAEDAHYFMIYANIICCMMERKELTL